QKILRMRGGTEVNGTRKADRGIGIGEDDGGSTVGDERAVGSAQRAGNQRILIRNGVAELDRQFLAQLSLGIVDAICLVLRRDPGERFRLIAIALKIKRGDAT